LIELVADGRWLLDHAADQQSLPWITLQNGISYAPRVADS
jgi:hypothetical protein